MDKKIQIIAIVGAIIFSIFVLTSPNDPIPLPEPTTNSKKITIEISRKIKKQLYLPKISAHRHLSRPLQRMGKTNRDTKFDTSFAWFHVYE